MSSFIPASRLITMSKQPNLFLLQPPSKIAAFEDLSKIENSSFVKQQLEEWHALRNSAMVTGSTLGKAIGLLTLKEQKEYYQHKFKNQKSKISDELKKILEYGTENEVY